MPGKQKSEWSKKLDQLKAQLPKGKLDIRQLKSCRVDGTWDKSKIASVCEAKGFKNKVDTVLAYLTHKDSKQKSSSKKRGVKKSATQNQPAVKWFSKKTYKDLTALDIGKVITMLTGIQKDREEIEIAELKEQRKQIDEKLKERGVK